MSAVLFGGTVPPLHAKTGDFLETDPYARARLEEAEEVLGAGILPRFARTSESYSREARQAYLVTCVALADRIRSEEGTPTSARRRASATSPRCTTWERCPSRT
ncbi:hypothetical protein HFP72_04200 [Nocardiopsis sp. ARC36]